MSRSPLLLVFALALGPVAACGETYIDTSLIDSVPDENTDSADTSAETPDPAPTDESGSRDFVATLELFALHAREISEVVADDRERAASYGH